MAAEYEVQKVVSAKDKRDFIGFPRKLYRHCPYRVPWFVRDIKEILNKRHPFFTHSDGDFFMVKRNGIVSGRIFIFENKRYNQQHKCSSAHFYFFDCSNDADSVSLLLDTCSDWSRGRNLADITGPLQFGGTAGNGILVHGFTHTSAMTMMEYNYPYYSRLLEEYGFKPYLDYFSARIDPSQFRLPQKVKRISEIVLKRGNFSIMNPSNKKELKEAAEEIGNMYNETLGIDHVENYKLSPEEVTRAAKDLLTVADPHLLKFIKYKGKIAGFLLAFPDLSKAIRRSKGNLYPWNILNLLLERGKTKSVIVNGAGIMPAYQRLGGNALLYSELEKTISGKGYTHADLTQVAESTGLMLSDIKTLGGEIYKIHRVFRYPL
ncbi:MAG: hypothetical protein ACLFST_09340 [Spirochaetia bacterium]